jgi:NTE family protein
MTLPLDDLIHELAAPPNRRGKHTGELEHHFYEGAVMVAEAEDAMSELTNTSKMNADWDFLLRLHSLGRRCANDWLSSKAQKIGVESTIDIVSKFL